MGAKRYQWWLNKHNMAKRKKPTRILNRYKLSGVVPKKNIHFSYEDLDGC